MDKGRHPNVTRAWLAGKTQNRVFKDRNLKTAPRKPPPHNKT